MDPTVWNSDVEWVQLPIGQPHMPAPSSGDEMEEIESSVAMEADLSLLQVGAHECRLPNHNPHVASHASHSPRVLHVYLPTCEGNERS